MTHAAYHSESLLQFWNREEHTHHLHQNPNTLTMLFSGGQDSMIALWLLYHTARTRAHLLRILHYNHMWQGDNFFMADHSTKLSFWLSCPQWTVMPTTQLNSEYDASQWRISTNTRLTGVETPSILMNGHTQSDLHESTLLAFARELTGQAALAGHATVPTPRPNTMHRPLTRMLRMETSFLVRTEHLPVYPDLSNIACDTTRAQLRYIVLPLLTHMGFGPLTSIELPGTRTQN